MRKLLLLISAAAMAASMPALAKDNGNGRGNQRAENHRGGGNEARSNRGRGNERRAERRDNRQERRAERRGDRQEQRAERRDDRREHRREARSERRDDRRTQRAERREHRFERRDDRREQRAERREDRRDYRQAERRDDRRDDRRADGREDRRDYRQAERRRGRDRVVHDTPRELARYDNQRNRNWLLAREDRRDDRRRYTDRVSYWREGRPLPVYVAERRNCPPGLARQNDFCLPPGQLRRSNYYNQRVSYDRYRDVPAEWQYRFRDDDDYSYRYDDDGYVYGIGRDTGVITTITSLFGGDLLLGEPMPIGYDTYNVPMTYRSAYADDDDWMYRYDDDAIYRVDQDTNQVDSLVALLSGNPLNVGQRLPSGYDAYNLPYDYRDEYMDSDEAMYRYSDGGIYEVDPTTMLVQALVEMVA